MDRFEDLFRICQKIWSVPGSQFETLSKKSLVSTEDTEEAYFLLKRGLNDSVIQAAFGGFNVIPTTYTLLVKELKTLTTNYEEGTIWGGSVRPMEMEQYPIQGATIVANLATSVENAKIQKWIKEHASIVRRRTTWQRTAEEEMG
ncbi:hypothetical protein AMATHDRAFT_9197 [Amanita thiersii Skay4041]|uniref:Uncharacterized protein n=1 Tax=Amanita thiersii Skay4041 TaxID=703135 RepID=A0A2A9NCN0_9AGAR|nr:hypothetical protein AMATHDRAFT_9197 [Amanita thiersii Skay4041]